MGAFFLLRDSEGPRHEARRDALLAALARQGFHSPRRFSAAGCNVYLYDKLLAAHENACQIDADNFCLSVGTFLYRAEMGTAALQRFHVEFQPGDISWDDIAGQFCLIVAKHGTVYLIGDRIGLYKV